MLAKDGVLNGMLLDDGEVLAGPPWQSAQGKDPGPVRDLPCNNTGPRAIEQVANSQSAGSGEYGQGRGPCSSCRSLLATSAPAIQTPPLAERTMGGPKWP